MSISIGIIAKQESELASMLAVRLDMMSQLAANMESLTVQSHEKDKRIKELEDEKKKLLDEKEKLIEEFDTKVAEYEKLLEIETSPEAEDKAE